MDAVSFNIQLPDNSGAEVVWQLKNKATGKKLVTNHRGQTRCYANQYRRYGKRHTFVQSNN